MTNTLAPFVPLQIKYKQHSAKELSKYHLSMDMMEVAHAKKAQSLVSDQDYRLTLHQYTALPDDMKVQAAKRAYALQSEVRITLQSALKSFNTIRKTVKTNHSSCLFESGTEKTIAENVHFPTCVCHRTCIVLT